MTVCIALLCRSVRERVFVLCADTELSGSGVDHSADKFYRLGNNFVALMAGPWPIVTRLCEKLKADISASVPTKDEDLVKRLKKISGAFAKSILYPKGSQPCSVLLTGFYGREPSYTPSMMHVYIHEKRAWVDPIRDRFEIGEGASLARAMLSQRNYTSVIDLDRAVYLAYEAKRFAEWADGVGPRTQIMVHSAMPEQADPKSEVCSMYVSKSGLEYLEELRQKYFLRTFVNDMEDLPPVDFYFGDYPFKS